MSDAEKKIYKANVEIGGEIFEQIEYADYSDSVACLREMMDAKFTLWDRITIPFCRLKYEIKNVIWNIRYGFQRMFKGYDNVDVFDMFYQFNKRYHKIFIELKKDKCSHPCNMTKEEWDNILDKMITNLYYMDETNVVNKLEEDAPEGFSPSYVAIYTVMNRHKDEFFKMFSEYFYNLWD